MNMAMVVDIGRDALFLTFMVAGPMLMAGLLIGLAVGIFQAVTQINEMTLTFIPKIVIVGVTMLLVMPWMLHKLMNFTTNIINMISVVGK